MAIYRSIQMSFWTDSKVVDDFTPEDRYFYLYLFTNPHTNLAGCYELSLKQASVETGYSTDSILNLLNRFERVHNVIQYSKQTKEILILHWYKYNWTLSEKFRKPLKAEIDRVKDNGFREYLIRLYEGNDTVSIPYPYPMDTTVTVTDTVSDTDTNTVSIKHKAIAEEFENLWKLYPKNKASNLPLSHMKRLVRMESHMKRWKTESRHIPSTLKGKTHSISRWGHRSLIRERGKTIGA